MFGGLAGRHIAAVVDGYQGKRILGATRAQQPPRGRNSRHAGATAATRAQQPLSSCSEAVEQHLGRNSPLPRSGTCSLAACCLPTLKNLNTGRTFTPSCALSASRFSCVVSNLTNVCARVDSAAGAHIDATGRAYIDTAKGAPCCTAGHGIVLPCRGRIIRVRNMRLLQHSIDVNVQGQRNTAVRDRQGRKHGRKGSARQEARQEGIGKAGSTAGRDQQGSKYVWEGSAREEARQEGTGKAGNTAGRDQRCDE
eukprot:365351-Chlamydomonas_euryale.AAC.9